MKNTLDFAEIADGHQFENLVADYFRETKEPKNIIEVDVKNSGEGSDGGRDILVTFRLTDSIISFERRWVVQCKFWEQSVSLRELSTVNLPTLIHQYNANGYLLVCKKNVTSNVTKAFEDLEKNCWMRYRYAIWSGNTFLTQLYVTPARPLIQKYFPEYYEFVESQERRMAEK